MVHVIITNTKSVPQRCSRCCSSWIRRHCLLYNFGILCKLFWNIMLNDGIQRCYSNRSCPRYRESNHWGPPSTRIQGVYIYHKSQDSAIDVDVVTLVAKQWIERIAVNFICKTKLVSKHDVCFMVTWQSKIVQWTETMLSKLATCPCIRWVHWVVVINSRRFQHCCYYRQ